MRPSFLDKNTKPVTTPPPRRRVHADTAESEQEPKPSPGLISLLRKFTSILLILMLATGLLLYLKRNEWGIATLVENYLPQKSNAAPIPIPDPAKYTSLTAELEANRKLFKTLYLGASTETERQKIITQASNLLEESLPPMMRCWLGHPWDFNGTATVPGEGKIACGYFVSVIMRDAGFKIDRVRVAQQASQNIIRTFVNHREFYEVKTNTPYPKYVDHINKKYEGIHIVGLDKHVAFIVIKNGKMRFIHSGGLQRRVVDEGRNEAYSLEHSNYRVISNISRNPKVIKKWILGERFPTVVSN